MNQDQVKLGQVAVDLVKKTDTISVVVAAFLRREKHIFKVYDPKTNNYV